MNNTNLKTFEAARAAIQEAALEGKSVSTVNRRWAAYFRAEDELKAAVGAGAR